VPLLHTPGIVVQKLQGGADLMTPGLAGGPPFPEKAKKGAVVAVASTDSPTVPLVVGQCEIDVSALQQVQGAKGHAVRTVHWSGDELWAWNASGKSGGAAPEHLDGWETQEEDTDALADQTERIDLDDDGDEGGGVPLSAGDRPVHREPEQSEVDKHDDTAEDDSLAQAEEREMTTQGKLLPTSVSHHH